MSRRAAKRVAARSDSAPARDFRIARFSLGPEEFAVISLPMPDSAALSSLSSSEREVAALALAGRSNRSIAEQRGTSPRTIANQIQSIYRKLGVGSRTELAARVSGGSNPVR